MNEKYDEKSFYPWMHVQDRKLVKIDEAPDIIRGEKYLLNTGKSCSDWFPDQIYFEMYNKNGTQLSDSIPNVLLLLIVSDKLKKILEAEASCEIEFLPINILDHEKSTLQADFYIANVLSSIRCMDAEASDFVPSSLDKNQVHHIKRLVIDNSKIPEKANIFRLGEEMDTVLVRGDLVNLITSAQCTGIHFIDLEDYGEEHRPIDRMEMISKLLDNYK